MGGWENIGVLQSLGGFGGGYEGKMLGGGEENAGNMCDRVGGEKGRKNIHVNYEST